MSEAVRDTVKNLREALGKTQTEFGEMIGGSLAMIQRYERLVAPKGKVLAKLERLATEYGFGEYAKVFDDALSQELGRPARRLVSAKAKHHPPQATDPEVVFENRMAPENEAEKVLIATVLRANRQPEYAEALRIACEALREPRSKVERDRTYLKQFPPFLAEVGRLHSHGLPKLAIAEKVGCDLSVVDRIVRLADLIPGLFETLGIERIKRILASLSLGNNQRMVAAESKVPIRAISEIAELRTYRLPTMREEQ